MAALNIKKGSTSHSAYDLSDSHSEMIVSHTLAVIVENEPGVLARVIGLFSARGYNIDSLTVADITEDHAVSRITIVTNGPPSVIDQIEAQLERLVPVHKVTDLTTAGPHVERELALIKVTGTGEKRVEALRLAELEPAEVQEGLFIATDNDVVAYLDLIEGFARCSQHPLNSQCSQRRICCTIEDHVSYHRWHLPTRHQPM